MPHAEGSSPYDAWAEAYDALRPEYPNEVYSTIEHFGEFDATPRVLEIGSGTGQASRQMVGRGWRVDALEPGERLVSAARARSDLVGVNFRVERFENAVIEPGSFDLVAAATSWHWVDSDVSYPKAHRALRPGGVIGLFWNAHVPNTSRAGWVPIRAAYLDAVPELAYLAPLTPDRPLYDPVSELRDSGCFGQVEHHVFAFERSYSADQFLRLIDTYASHSSLEPGRRARLHDKLRSTIDVELGGTVTKPYEAVVVLGRRLEQ